MGTVDGELLSEEAIADRAGEGDRGKGRELSVETRWDLWSRSWIVVDCILNLLIKVKDLNKNIYY